MLPSTALRAALSPHVALPRSRGALSVPQAAAREADSGMRPVPPSTSATQPAGRDGRTGEYTNPYTVSWFGALKFTSPAPERINGRLAMLALVEAALRESRTGETLLQQAAAPSWAFVAAAIVITYASLVPVTKGAIDEDFYWFSVRAEKTNGRAAMLGFATLLVLEWAAGVPFF